MATVGSLRVGLQIQVPAGEPSRVAMLGAVVVGLQKEHWTLEKWEQAPSTIIATFSRLWSLEGEKVTDGTVQLPLVPPDAAPGWAGVPVTEPTDAAQA